MISKHLHLLFGFLLLIQVSCSTFKSSWPFFRNYFGVQNNLEEQIQPLIYEKQSIFGVPSMPAINSIFQNPWTMDIYPFLTPVSNSQIAGQWKAVLLRGKTVNINISISNREISYKYCNSKTMSYFLQGEQSIKIIPGISTLMVCTGLTPTQQQFDKIFTSVVRYKIVGSQLHLFDDSGILNVILQKNIQKSKISQIVGVWTTTSVSDKKVSIVINITQNAIQFTYCNTKSYPYKLTGNNISVALGMSTKIICGNINPPEQLVNNAFSSISSFSINRQGLTFFNSKGKQVIKLISGNHSLSLLSTIKQFVGNWTAINVNGKNVTINVIIDGCSIQYNYCNDKKFNYNLKGNKIELDIGMTTLKQCKRLNPTQSQVDRTFSSVSSYKIESDNKLLLLDNRGKTIVTLQKQDKNPLNQLSSKNNSLSRV